MFFSQLSSRGTSSFSSKSSLTESSVASAVDSSRASSEASSPREDSSSGQDSQRGQGEHSLFTCGEFSYRVILPSIPVVLDALFHFGQGHLSYPQWMEAFLRSLKPLGRSPVLSLELLDLPPFASCRGRIEDIFASFVQMQGEGIDVHENQNTFSTGKHLWRLLSVPYRQKLTWEGNLIRQEWSFSQYTEVLGKNLLARQRSSSQTLQTLQTLEDSLTQEWETGFFSWSLWEQEGHRQKTFALLEMLLQSDSF